MSRVAIVKGDAYNATVKALEYLGFRRVVQGRSFIVIKPNLTNAFSAEEGVTTDVNVVKAILDQLRGLNVVIAEGPGGAEAMEAFKKNGYLKLGEEYDVRLIDLNKDDFKEVQVKKPLALKSIKVSKTILKSDFLISVAKLKVHSAAVTTGVLKNMMGACPREQKLEIHAYIPWSLVDLSTVVLPSFGVIDGVVGNEVNEATPNPVNMGVVLASSDCVALDAVASEVMGVHPKDVPYIWKAAEKGLGIADLRRIEIVGERIEAVKKPFKRRGVYLGSYTRILLRILAKLKLLPLAKYCYEKFFK